MTDLNQINNGVCIYNHKGETTVQLFDKENKTIEKLEGFQFNIQLIDGVYVISHNFEFKSDINDPYFKYDYIHLFSVVNCNQIDIYPYELDEETS